MIGKTITIRLIDEVAAGGEGIIYTTNTPYVAKIYKSKNNTRRKYEKIKLMLSKKIECNGICYPIAALYNNKTSHDKLFCHGRFFIIKPVIPHYACFFTT